MKAVKMKAAAADVVGSCKDESFVTDVMDRNITAEISTSLVGKMSVFCLKKPVLT